MNKLLIQDTIHLEQTECGTHFLFNCITSLPLS